MVPKMALSDATVTCNCGASYSVANPEFTTSITCGACGSKITLNEKNTYYGSEPKPSALAQAMKSASPVEKAQEATRLVRDGQYVEAIEMYKSVLEQVAPHRDAFYGMGFSYLHLGKVEQAFVMFGVAAGLGHRGAIDMYKRIRERVTFT